VKFDFHTNPDESPSNGLSGGKNENKASLRISPKQAKLYFHTNPLAIVLAGSWRSTPH
jgi:hypothetical protein